MSGLVITTAGHHGGRRCRCVPPLKELSKFLVILAMAAIGLNTDIVKLVRSGGKPILMGACCWAGISGVSLAMQHWQGLL